MDEYNTKLSNDTIRGYPKRFSLKLLKSLVDKNRNDTPLAVNNTEECEAACLGMPYRMCASFHYLKSRNATHHRRWCLITPYTGIAVKEAELRSYNSISLYVRIRWNTGEITLY